MSNIFPAGWMTEATAMERAQAWREGTTEDERKEITALRLAAEEAESAARRATLAFERAQRYSAPVLRDMVERGEAEVGAGNVREARALLAQPALDTPARRQRAIAIAHTGTNLGLWGRWSEAVHYAAVDLARMIQDGKEGEEHYTERTAREYRERDMAAREALLSRTADALRKS